mmetsp:Transcript_476/g.1572  ORF Transcript_476/g.1572 Transcript_476/m.1572 type:complete len:465 (+) Transcript_476:764-2158(+)
MRAPELHDLARRVLHDLPDLDHVAVTQFDLAAWSEAEVRVRGVLAEVFPLDPHLAREPHLPRSHLWNARVVLGLHLLLLALGVVLDDHLQGVQDHHPARHLRVKVVADAILQKGHVGHRDLLGDAHLHDEALERLGSHATPSHTAQRRHARVIPAVHHLCLDQLEQFALGRQVISNVKASKLELQGCLVDRQVCREPVVQLAVRVELHGADGVGDALNGVLLSVGKIVQRINAPLVARAVVALVDYPVDGHVPHAHVGACHVPLHAQHMLTLLVLSVSHLAEELEVFVRCASAELALRARGALGFHLLFRLGVHEGLALLYKVLRPFVQLVEVRGSKVEVLAPIKPQPLDVLLNGLDVLRLLRGRVCVVEAQMAPTAIQLSQGEVDDDGLGVPNVYVPVGLGREARSDDVADPAIPASAPAPGGKVRLDDLLEEAERTRRLRDAIAPDLRRPWGRSSWCRGPCL